MDSESINSVHDINIEAKKILLRTANLLASTDVWFRGSSFKKSSNTTCLMCAHGAISYCSDSIIKTLIDHGQINLAKNRLIANHFSSHYPDTRLLDLLTASNRNKIPAAVWNSAWAMAHFKAFKVGLDFAFNDDPATTKTKVISKLKQAACSRYNFKNESLSVPSSPHRS